MIHDNVCDLGINATIRTAKTNRTGGMSLTIPEYVVECIETTAKPTREDK